MSCYRVNFFKYPRISLEEQKYFLELIRHRKPISDVGENFITFGKFDRMSVEHIQDITRARDIPPSVKMWEGDYTSILLYDINPYSEMFVERDENSSGIICIGEGQPLAEFRNQPPRFITCTLINFNGIVTSEIKDYRWLLEAAKKEIKEIINTLNNNGTIGRINACVLGAFGLADLCILSTLDQYVDIIATVNKIQKICCTNQYPNGVKNEPLFSDVNTIISVNRTSNEANFDCTKGVANILVSVKGGCSKETLLNALGEKIDFENIDCAFATLGEYDYMLRINASVAIPLFLKKGILHYENAFYVNHILQTHLLLSEEINLSKSPCETVYNSHEIDITSNSIGSISNLYDVLNERLKKINEEYLRLRQSARKLFPPNSYFIDELDAFYLDFRNNEKSTQKICRRIDFAKQFFVLISIANEKIQYILESKEQTTQSIYEQMEFFRKLLSVFSVHVQHEVQTNSFSFDSPDCHVRYNAPQDIVINAYYNLTRQIFKASKAFKGESQFECCPLISVDSVARIKSRDFHSPQQSKNTERIIHYELPTSIMLDLPSGLFSILHETCHYIVPFSRKVRNILLWTLFFNEFYIDLYRNLITNTIIEDLSITNSIEKDRVIRTINEAIFEISFYGHLREIYDLADNTYCGLVGSNGNSVAQYTHYMKGSMIGTAISNNNMVEQYKNLKSLKAGLPSAIDNLNFGKKINAESILEKAEALLSSDVGANLYKAYMKESSNEIYSKIIEPFHELRSDIMMIDICKISLVDYLLHIIQILKAVLINETSPLQPQDMLRLAIVIFYLRKNKESCSTVECIRNNKNEFIKRYVARFLTHNTQNISKSIKEKLSEANKWFNKLIQLCAEYDDYYSKYTVIFAELIQLYSLDIRTENANSFPVINCVRNFFKNDSNREIIFSNALMENYNTHEATDEKYIKIISDNQKATFNNYLNFVLSMQTVEL